MLLLNCGCAVGDGVMAFCPLHKSAPKLYEACEEMVKILDEYSYYDNRLRALRATLKQILPKVEVK